MSIEAMKLALEEMRCCNYNSAAERLKHAIEQAEQAQPVAWRTFDGEGGYEFRDYDMNEDYGDWWAQRHPNHLNWVDPLYTAPPPRQPLTDEQILAVARDHYTPHQRPEISFARAIEAAHGINKR